MGTKVPPLVNPQEKTPAVVRLHGWRDQAVSDHPCEECAGWGTKERWIRPNSEKKRLVFKTCLTCNGTGRA